MCILLSNFAAQFFRLVENDLKKGLDDDKKNNNSSFNCRFSFRAEF